jgi:NAD(P)-dependent dehydrogenase (short-subunit alcohol dehydrogenase family)
MVDGKVILVTGAASGIGRASALALARAGARLVLGDVAAAGEDIAGAGRAADERRVTWANASLRLKCSASPFDCNLRKR